MVEFWIVGCLNNLGITADRNPYLLDHQQLFVVLLNVFLELVAGKWAMNSHKGLIVKNILLAVNQ